MLKRESEKLTNIDFLRDQTYSCVNLYDNEISDISAIGDDRSIIKLILDKNRLENVDPIQGHPTLRHVSAMMNKLTTLDFLKRTRIECIVLAGNAIVNIDALRHNMLVTHVDLTRNSIEDIDALACNSTIERLNLNTNKITSIIPLRHVFSLRILDISRNSIQSVEALRNLKKLEFLSIAHNDISDLEPLKGCHNLKFIGFNKNRVEDISPLMTLSYLEHFVADSQHYEELMTLVEFNRANRCNRETTLSELITGESPEEADWVKSMNIIYRYHYASHHHLFNKPLDIEAVNQ